MAFFLYLKKKTNFGIYHVKSMSANSTAAVNADLVLKTL